MHIGRGREGERAGRVGMSEGNRHKERRVRGEG